MIKEKKCKKCGSNQFIPNGKYTRCGPCTKKTKSENRINNPKIKKAESLSHIKYYYGISIDEYHRMVKRQNNLCAICNKPEIKRSRLSIDHCHTTKKVRGLLCDNCNKALGCFKDSIYNLKNAIKYLGGENES